MKLVADKHIPLVNELFASQFTIEQLAADEITPTNIKNADVLLVRSVKKITKDLLAESQLKCVATTTSGFDHLDIEFLEKVGIKWFHAPGCNALAVAEYVVCCIAVLRKQNLLIQKPLRAGVIGIGQVGSRVVTKLKNLGFEIIMHDPLRAASEPDFHSTPLEQFQDLDLICIHTPLTNTGKHPTYHFLAKDFFLQQKKSCVLLNAARGAVINSADLKQHGQHLIKCLDVWEGEPEIDLELLNQTTIATPHIAGHAIQGKWRGTRMCRDAIFNYFNLAIPPEIDYPIARPEISLSDSALTWEDIVLKIYNPIDDMQTFKDALAKNNSANTFTKLRNHYRIRHEFAYPKIQTSISTSLTLALLEHLGLELDPIPKC